MTTDLTALKPGQALAARRFGPITRQVLALYAGGSGDHNPMHIDIDFARKAGAADVFAHGMLSMAYLSQYVLGFATQRALLSLSARFKSITPVAAIVTCTGEVIARDDEGRTITLSLKAYIDDGIQTVAAVSRLALCGAR